MGAYFSIQEKCLGLPTDKNVHTIILGCPDTFHHTSSGKMLSGMGVPDIIGTQRTFSFYTTDKTESSQVNDSNFLYR